MKTKHYFSIGLSTLLTTGAHLAIAAPGNLSEKPLSLGSITKPNVLFLVDDSSSMNSTMLKRDAANGDTTVGLEENAPIGVVLRLVASNHAPEMKKLKMICPGFNAMYYNPNVDYTPWVGVDINGIAYADQINLSRVRNNPYDPGEGTIDLFNPPFNVTAGYVPWNNVNGNDTFETNECYENNLSLAASEFVSFSSMTAVQKINFANWYSYYRSRIQTMKRVMSEVIKDTTYRVGMATINDPDESGNESHAYWKNVGVLVKDADNISIPLNPVAEAHKKELLDKLFKIKPYGGTPLRGAFAHAGEYFEHGVVPNDGFFGISAEDSSPDNFSSSTPILKEDHGGSCQQNFTIVFSDGYWTGSDGMGAINWRNTDADPGASSSPYVNSSFDGGSHADTFSGTMADIAMHYYERDLVPGLADEVPTNIVDTNSMQHMVTYGVTFGINGHVTSDPLNRTTPFDWYPMLTDGQKNSGNPALLKDKREAYDDVRHAVWNGRGELLSAKDPEELLKSFEAIFANIDNRVNSIAAVSLTSGRISSTTKVFQAIYDPSNWLGDIFAYGFNSANELIETPIWRASELLKARVLTDGYESRNMMTFNGTRGINFAFPDDYESLDNTTLSPFQVNDLLTNAPYPSAINTAEKTENINFGKALAQYLSGDNSNEGTAGNQFRQRSDYYLGDIIHGGPVYIGKPNAPYPNNIASHIGNSSDYVGYHEFAKNNISRQGVVYAGSNDGFMHAFNSDTGEELYAFMPHTLSTNSDKGVHELAEQGYDHKSYVDGSITVADVFLENPKLGGIPQWRSYLVGSLRKGGKGIYVLDVTDPAPFLGGTLTKTALDGLANKMVVGEFTHPELGYTYSKPQITMLNNGRWAAIFGNGYNNEGDGRAKLFILYLDDLSVDVLDTAEGSISSGDCLNVSSDCNGLSSPTLIDINSDSRVDYVYAGDLHGNLWRFNLSADSTAYTSSTAKLVFKACSTAPCNNITRQPITVKPVVRSHPYRQSTNTSPNTLVFFGTGQYITEDDITNTDVQSFYGVWDNGKNVYDRRRLVEQVVTEDILGSDIIRTVTSNTVNYSSSGSSSSKWGWVMDLPDTGERVVLEPKLFGHNVIFATSVPSADACGSSGYSFMMGLKFLNGGAATNGTPDPKTDIVFPDRDIDTDSILVSGYRTGSGSELAITDNGEILRTVGTGLTLERVSKRDFGRQGRKTWSIRR